MLVPELFCTPRLCLRLPPPTTNERVRPDGPSLRPIRQVLRFSARFSERDTRLQAFDPSREFVVTFFLVDDSIAVFEPPVPNSGLPGGKFLDRTHGAVRKPGSRACYKARDFFVGAILEIACRVFELTAADDRTQALQAAALAG